MLEVVELHILIKNQEALLHSREGYCAVGKRRKLLLDSPDDLKNSHVAGIEGAYKGVDFWCVPGIW